MMMRVQVKNMSLVTGNQDHLTSHLLMVMSVMARIVITTKMVNMATLLVIFMASIVLETESTMGRDVAAAPALHSENQYS